MCVVVDSDITAGSGVDKSATLSVDAVTEMVRKHDPALIGHKDRLTIDDGAAEICVVRWQAGDPAYALVPQLESRLKACGAWPVAEALAG